MSMNTPPPKNIKVATNNRNQAQLRLEGDLTQINEQVANERQEESSLRGRLRLNTNSIASDENIQTNRPQKITQPRTEEDRQMLFMSSPDVPNE